MSGPDPKPGVPDPHRDDIDDPTGVHHLLSSLPAPGPMPDELVERIQRSLREEADRRDERDGSVSYALFAGRSRRRRGPGTWLRVAAVAALTVLVGGGVLAGTGAFGPNVLSMLGVAPKTTPATAAPGLSSGGGAALPSTTVASQSGESGRSGPMQTTGEQPGGGQSSGHGTGGPEQRATVATGPQTFHQTNTAYTGANLLDRARAVVVSPPVSLHPGATEGPYIGPIATPTGLATCLAALDLPSTARAEVDLGTYDGKPAAIIITHAGDHDEVRVVRRSCTTNDPGLLTGPYPL